MYNIQATVYQLWHDLPLFPLQFIWCLYKFFAIVLVDRGQRSNVIQNLIQMSKVITNLIQMFNV